MEELKVAQLAYNVTLCELGHSDDESLNCICFIWVWNLVSRRQTGRHTEEDRALGRVFRLLKLAWKNLL
jgi:hypothetical protein